MKKQVDIIMDYITSAKVTTIGTKKVRQEIEKMFNVVTTGERHMICFECIEKRDCQPSAFQLYYEECPECGKKCTTIADPLTAQRKHKNVEKTKHPKKERLRTPTDGQAARKKGAKIPVQ